MKEKGKRKRTKDAGVYCLVGAVKMHNGKPDECFESIYIKIDLLYTSPQQGGEPWQSVKIAAQNMR